MVAASVTGHDRDAQGNYQAASVPPVTFSYSQFRPHEQRYQSLTALGGLMPPLALNDPNMALVDLFGDGLPDLLHTGDDGFRYWRNLGQRQLRPTAPAAHTAGRRCGSTSLASALATWRATASRTCWSTPARCRLFRDHARRRLAAFRAL